MDAKVSGRVGSLDGVVGRIANDGCIRQSKEAVAKYVRSSRYPILSRHDAGFGHLDKETVAACVVATAQIDGTSRRRIFSHRQVVAAGGRWFTIHDAANHKQQGSLFGEEFRQGQRS